MDHAGPSALGRERRRAVGDFSVADDLIDLSGFAGITGFGDLTITGESDGVVIDLSEFGGGTVTLQDVTLADLSADHFVFQNRNEDDAGTNWIQGTSGDDTLEGETGDDYILGREGDDLIFGGEGNDRLYGDLEGQSGNDTLYGGEGEDTFAFIPSTSGGTNVINDFADGEEVDVILEGVGGVDALVRAKHDRRLGEGVSKLFATLRNAPADGHVEIEIDRRSERRKSSRKQARPARSARVASAEVHYRELTLPATVEGREPVTLWRGYERMSAATLGYRIAQRQLSAPGSP